MYIIGIAIRSCSEDGVWDENTNIDQCQNIELIVLDDVISEELEILANTLVMDFSTPFDIIEVQEVSEELSLLTATSFAILPNDLSTSNDIVKSITRSVKLQMLPCYFKSLAK